MSGEELPLWARIFQLYINEKRMLRVFAKKGAIKSSCKQQLARYIRLIKKDALHDFHRDYSAFEGKFNKEEQQKIFDADDQIRELLLRFLENQPMKSI